MPVSTVTETSSVKQFTVPVRVRVPHTEKQQIDFTFSKMGVAISEKISSY